MPRVSDASSTARFQPTGGGVEVFNVLYLPSLQNVVSSSSFKDASLESTYQRYSHWQRQKLLIMVNAVDVVLKIITAAVISTQYRNSPGDFPNCPVDLLTSSVNSSECYSSSSEKGSPQSSLGEFPIKTVIWASCLILMNVVILLLAFFWKQLANNYLHLAALATWLLMNIQGKVEKKNLISKSFLPGRQKE